MVPAISFGSTEYEEEIYLSLDGSATVYVNSSVPALNALRGASIDVSPNGTIDLAQVSALYETPVTHVSRVTQSRRSGRWFVHVRLDVADVRRLSEAAPFAWSAYRFNRDGNLFVYRQTIQAAAGKEVGDVGWTGQEVVAFRLHLPSKVRYHNTTPDNPKRGNIVVWEQRLDERRHGKPLTPRREDGSGVDPLLDAAVVRRHLCGGRRDVRRRDLVDSPAGRKARRKGAGGQRLGTGSWVVQPASPQLPSPKRR